jgi:hypothetical protein
MSSIPTQETFDLMVDDLSKKWFPDGAGAKTPWEVQKIEIKRPVGQGAKWTFTAIVWDGSRLRRISIWTENPGTHKDKLALALQDAYDRVDGVS